MNFINYRVSWNSSCCQFTVRETRSFRNIQNVTDFDTYDTFAAAYDAAKLAYEELSKYQKDVYLVSKEICCEALQGSWGMRPAQKAEIAQYLPKQDKTAPMPSEQDREVASQPTPSVTEDLNLTVDLSRFSPAQQLELQKGIDLNLPVWMYANPMYTPAEMAGLRNILQTTVYAREHPGVRVVATDHGPEEVTLGFKSRDNFKNHPDSVCYVPENWDFEEDGPGYTARDILELCEGDSLKAEIIFDLCDWQHPSTVLGEWDIDDERALEQRRSELTLKNRTKAAIPLSEQIRSAESRRTQAMAQDQDKYFGKGHQPTR